MRPRLIPRRAALVPSGVAAVTAAALLAVAGCSGDSAAAAGIDTYSAGHQQVVGNVSGPTLSGGSLALSAMRGHVVVVNFWASNCAPCRAEQSNLDEVQKAEAGRGVKFVGIDYRDTSPADARAFLRSHPATYPSIVDSTGTTALDFPGAEPQTTPTTIILTPQGRIAVRINGSVLYTQLKSLVDKVLAGQT